MTTEEQVRLILGRDEKPVHYEQSWYDGKKILVTGAAGSLGVPLVNRLREHGATVADTDITDLDVVNDIEVWDFFRHFYPDLVFHLAAQKHAPEGESEVGDTVDINIIGVMNVLDSTAAPVVLTSTCKAAEPETVYGASKLIAERMVLNAGGTVVRLFNVVQAAGNVFETWANLEDPVPVTRCRRYFISLQEAVHAILLAPQLVPGRYSPIPGSPRFMWQVADDLGRKYERIPVRRGDRRAEPLHARNEMLQWTNDMWRVVATHDA